MKAVLLYNPQTGDIKQTQAKPNGPVIKKYYEQGFIAIGNVSGFNVSVFKLHPNQIPQFKTQNRCVVCDEFIRDGYKYCSESCLIRGECSFPA